MALFKPLLGKRENLPAALTSGYAYFCTDDGSFWIDYTDSDRVVKRKQINAQEAEKLIGYDITTTVVNDNTVIPVASAVYSAIEAATEVYVGPTQPTDPNIKVWINTSEEGTGVVPVLPRVTTISLPQASWVGSSSPYSQVVSINTVTSDTKIELNPTVAQIVSLQNDDIALMAENDGGIVTIYSFGGVPSSNMTMQVTLQEVAYV